MTAEEVKALIEKGIEGCEAIISGDGDHFEAKIVSSAFAGKKMIEQHRMVYATLGDVMQSEIHALRCRPLHPMSGTKQTAKTT